MQEVGDHSHTPFRLLRSGLATGSAHVSVAAAVLTLSLPGCVAHPEALDLTPNV